MRRSRLWPGCAYRRPKASYSLRSAAPRHRPPRQAGEAAAQSCFLPEAARAFRERLAAALWRRASSVRREKGRRLERRRSGPSSQARCAALQPGHLAGGPATPTWQHVRSAAAVAEAFLARAVLSELQKARRHCWHSGSAAPRVRCHARRRRAQSRRLGAALHALCAPRSTPRRVAVRRKHTQAALRPSRAAARPAWQTAETPRALSTEAWHQETAPPAALSRAAATAVCQEEGGPQHEARARQGSLPRQAQPRVARRPPCRIGPGVL